MRVVRDLIGNNPPAPFDVIFGTDDAGAGGTIGYKGALIKALDHDDIDHGPLFTLASIATTLEGVAGILEEDVAVSTTYTMDVAAGSGDFVRKKMAPCGPTTVVEAEYVQADAAGTDNTRTGITGAAASTAITVASSIGTADVLIGAWIYFLTGANANYLHFIRDNGSTTAITLRTALVNAVTATDTFLLIMPPMAPTVDFNATYTDIKSEYVKASMTDEIGGIDYFISAPGIRKTKLTQTAHDGKSIRLARFYHQFVLPFENYWSNPNRA